MRGRLVCLAAAAICLIAGNAWAGIEIVDSAGLLRGVHPAPEEMLRVIAAQLRPDVPVRIKLVAYAGFPEHATILADNTGIVTIPIRVDSDPPDTSVQIAYQIAQAVRIATIAKAADRTRSIGGRVLSDGLAMRVARSVFPDRPDTDFTETRPGWLADADAHRTAILQDVRAVLNAGDIKTFALFTRKRGPAGIEREADYAGWQVVGFWLAHGESFAEIARVKEADAPARVAEAIDLMLNEPR